MRLEENERLEKLEVEELARAKGESTLFESKEAEVFPARRAREQFEKFFVPGFAVLLFLLEAGGAWLLWRWIGQDHQRHCARPRDGVAVALRHFCAAAVFAGPVFRDHRAAGRPPAAAARREFSAGGRVCLLCHGAGHRRRRGGISRADFWLARALCVLLGLMAAEMLVTLLLEIYRPRVKGKVARPLYDSRLVGLLAQPESLFTTAAQALDYQFGFKVSETWFFQLLQKKPAGAVAGATGGAAAVHVRGVH